MCLIDKNDVDPFQWTHLLLLCSSQYDPFKSQLTDTYNSRMGTLKTQLGSQELSMLEFHFCLIWLQ